MKRRRFFPENIISVFVVTIMAGLGCNDPLPTYVQPTVTIATILPSATLDTVLYAETAQDFYPDGPLEVRPPTPMVFTFYEENQYQETLYGTASVSGTLQLWVVEQPEIEASIPVTASDIVPGTAYDPNTGILTMDPSRLVMFQVAWNLRDSNGDRFYRALTSYRTEPYTGNAGYSFLKISTIHLHVRATVQLYAQTSTFVGDQVYVLTVLGGIIEVP